MDDTESTTSVEDNLGNLDNPTRDTLAEGLLGLLKPTVDRLDDKVRATRVSQLELKRQLEFLSEELMKIREALNHHPDLEPYVKKLITCKHQVTVVFNVLQVAQDRLTDIRRMIGIERGVHAAIINSAENLEPTQSTSRIN